MPIQRFTQVLRFLQRVLALVVVMTIATGTGPIGASAATPVPTSTPTPTASASATPAATVTPVLSTTPAPFGGISSSCTGASSVFLSGTIRDFPSTQSDFNVATSGDSSTAFVNPTLAGDGTPTLASGVSLSTVKSAASFAQWWHASSASRSEVLTESLSNACQTDPRVFEYNNQAFYPIDGQLLGNDGGAHNNWFTDQMQGYIAYQGGEVLQYSSSDDLWVFVNGHLAVDLGGVHTTKSASVSLDAAHTTLGITPGNQYPIAIFFAHRGQHTPELGMQTLGAALCNALASATTMTPSMSDLELSNGASVNGSSLSLISSTAVGPVATAAWSPNEINIASGFSTQFDYALTPGSSGAAQGFAFVVQSAGASQLGGDGFNLGYAGIPNSLAVAFETLQNSALSEPAYQNLSAQTMYAAQNSASASASIARSLAVNRGGEPLMIADGQSHHVQMQYAPSAGLGGGWLTMWTWENSSPPSVDANNMVPWLQAQLTPASFAAIAAPSAYLGFTAASDATNSESVTISNWTVTPVLPSASGSVVEQVPTSVRAGQATQATLQLKDACNTVLGTEAVGDSALVQGVYSNTTGNEVDVATIKDNGDGTYGLSFTPSLPGSYQLTVQVAGQPLTTGPVTVKVS